MRVGIVSNNLSPSTFSSIISNLSDLMDQDVTFVFSDQYPIIATFFNRRGYRKCELYHIGERSKHNIGKYKLNGGHVSYSIINVILEQCEHVIRV